MYRIIGSRGSGKTTAIVELAKKKNAIVVCYSPPATKKALEERGINCSNIRFMSINDFLYNNRGTKDCYLIDELDWLLKMINFNIIGYSLTEDD